MEGDSYKLRGLREGERDAPRRDKEKGGKGNNWRERGEMSVYLSLGPVWLRALIHAPWSATEIASFHRRASTL
jgi:hypothetical protein